MTLYLNFRSQSVGGSVIDPYPLSGDGTASPLALQALDPTAFETLVSGKRVLFCAHGFNVSYENGVRSLARLEPYLGLTAQEVFIGVLWPGDYWLPVVNYPFEGEVAIDCGKRLARFCTQSVRRAQSLSFASHSLGARLVLEAAKNLDSAAHSVCLTAPAINQDCLAAEYKSAAANAASISILASHEDLVLKYAFRIGDPISNLLHDDHNASETALGYDGPPVPAQPPVAFPWQIPDRDGYGHGDYLPPADSPSVTAPKWRRSAAFISRAFRQLQQSWP